MKRFLKILLWTLLVLLLLLFAAGSLFIYKVKNGFPVAYETEAPAIDFPANQAAVLVFSKTTGFRHDESIEASHPVLAEMARRNHWFLYETESGGVFNPEQLARFSAVVFNNSTGRVLSDEQQRALENYVDNGGSLLGIHGAGDDSHHWNWYVSNLTGRFSHHPLNPQFQPAEVLLDPPTDSILWQKLPTRWPHTEEWYVFFDNPRTKGFNVVCSIDGESILPSGNILWTTDKGFGMSKDHPIAWYKTVGKGKTFYTSMGHDRRAWDNPHFVQLIENALQWAVAR